MPRTDETWALVMASPLMNDAMKQVYYVLWQPPEGLTKGEIEMTCKAVGIPKNPEAPWEKQIPVLVKMGLLKKGNKRHCKAKNKEDVAWVLTDLAVPIRPKANKPAAKAFLKAVAQFEMLMVHHDSRGDGLVTPELRKLYDWIRDKVPEPTS
jgi:hypothetical protein